MMAGLVRVKQLTVSYLGNFRFGHCSEWDITKSLESLGHEVRRLQEGSVRAADVPGLAAGSDLFLWTQTYSLASGTGSVPERAEMVAKIKAEGIPTVGVHLDKWWGLPRESQFDEEPFLRDLDWLFTADGGNQQRFGALGINHSWLPPGVLAGNCVIEEPRPAYACDVVFIGSVLDYHPEWRHRQDLVSFLASAYGRRFRHFGRGGQPLAMEETGVAIASAKVVVGDSCILDGATRYFSNRIPETLGRGGFLLHPRVEGIEEWYADGEHLCLYEPYDWDGLDALIDRYLRDEKGRRAIATSGRDLVLGRDTFAHRMEKVLDVVLGEGATPRQRIRLTNPVDLTTAWEVWDEDVYQAEPFLTPGCTVVDVGANVGLFAVWALERGAGRVVAVEPWEPNREQLVEHAGLVGGDVDILPVAVWSERGQRDWQLGEGDAAGRDAHLLPGVGDVEIMTLDDVLAGIDEVAVLKLDVEGAEYAAIEGASIETLGRCRYVTMEFHDPAIAARCGWDRPGALGAMVHKLAETHKVEVIGRPSAGGYVRAIRYEETA